MPAANARRIQEGAQGTHQLGRRRLMKSSVGGPRMKKQAIKKSANQWVRLPLFFSNPKEKEAFLASVRQLDEQSDRLGVFDPPETEPAVLYSSREEEK
jgi:hypothetical protein